MAYVISADSVDMKNISIPFASTSGHSKIVNYEDLKLYEAATGESIVANATINLDALRHERGRLGMSNFIARQRFELYVKSYADHSFYLANNLSKMNPNRAHCIENQTLTTKKLKGKGVI
jgi:hypothetical protein